MVDFVPSYINQYRTGELHKKRDQLFKKLECCDLCPRECRVNRNKHVGSCRVGNTIKVSEYVLYPGEEPVLQGRNGAGAVFFSNCTMRCVYCQNFQFSQLGKGREMSSKELGEVFLDLQFNKDASNLDLVTATPYLPFIFEALIYAIERGFNLPIIWNTSSYEKIETLTFLEGIVDIYLPDIRYTSNIVGKKYSGVNDYWSKARLAVKEMYRQIGDTFLLKEDKDTIELKRGIIIRLLVLPNYLNQAKEALKFIKYEISENVHISLMDQYVPVYKAKQYEKISRYLSKSEYIEVINYMNNLGFKNGWIQTHLLDKSY